MTPSAERRAGRLRRGAAHVLPVALALLAAGAAWHHRDALLAALTAAARSPEAQVREVLAHQAGAGVSLPGGARAELSPVRYGDVAVEVDGDRARVLAMVEGTGEVILDGRRVELGYVGREAFAVVRCRGARWCPDGAALPALRGVLEALRRRAEADAPRVRVRAWQIRVKRDRATAGEDYDLLLPGGAERRRAVHGLVRAAGAWVFVDGP